VKAGLGLGLYISRKLAEAHAGEISVVSQKNQGSTFTLRLPLKSVAA
jgi:signal transduction histidine kinase